MSPGIWQILIIVLLVVLLFGGRGKISSIMGDFAKGIKSFRKGLSEEDEGEKRADSAENESPKMVSSGAADEVTDIDPQTGEATKKDSASA